MITKVTPGLKISGSAELPNTATISSYSGRNDINVDIAIHGPGLSHGLGLRFQNGEEGLVLVAGEVEDSDVSRMQRLILMTYQTIGAQRAVESLGYRASVASETKQSVHVEAVMA